MPTLDLSKLWEEHTKHEFATRDTEATLATMVEDAYVNHIPVMTGGNGKAALREFYSRHFIPSMPPDTTLTPISRTVGEDQLVDEMIFSFTHTQEMPWMLPGVAPTGHRVEVALVAIVRFRGRMRFKSTIAARTILGAGFHVILNSRPATSQEFDLTPPEKRAPARSRAA